jgi:N-acetyl-gamma-glutamyl-phosphate reductase
MANDGRLRAAIYGGSGYGGSELLRILLFHPNVEIALVTANEHAGKAVTSVHQNLRGLTDLVFEPAPDSLTDIDVVFLAMPHGHAAAVVPTLPENIRVIDLSGDFRLSDAGQIKEFYGRDNADLGLQSKFVYGLSETNRDAIGSTQYIANPGCFATATLLALAPMLAGGLVTGKVIVDAKTGSSGSGAKPAANTHHPQRSNSFYAYKPFRHQHLPEIEQHLAEIGSDPSGGIVFMTHSLPVSRGIFASCYFETTEDISTAELRNIYDEYYKDAFFVRMVETSPDINWVKGTNFCDIAVNANGRNAVVFSAIDNLVKGAAGQAVQNMNIMHGFAENTGLLLTGSNP